MIKQEVHDIIANQMEENPQPVGQLCDKDIIENASNDLDKNMTKKADNMTKMNGAKNLKIDREKFNPPSCCTICVVLPNGSAKCKFLGQNT